MRCGRLTNPTNYVFTSPRHHPHDITIYTENDDLWVPKLIREWKLIAKATDVEIKRNPVNCTTPPDRSDPCCFPIGEKVDWAVADCQEVLLLLLLMWVGKVMETTAWKIKRERKSRGRGCLERGRQLNHLPPFILWCTRENLSILLLRGNSRGHRQAHYSRFAPLFFLFSILLFFHHDDFTFVEIEFPLNGRGGKIDQVLLLFIAAERTTSSWRFRLGLLWEREKGDYTHLQQFMAVM